MQFGELLFGRYMLGRPCHGRLDQLLNLMFNFFAWASSRLSSASIRKSLRKRQVLVQKPLQLFFTAIQGFSPTPGVTPQIPTILKSALLARHGVS